MESPTLPKDEEFYKEAFAKMDVNNDGILNEDEIDNFIKSMGIIINEQELNEFKEKIQNSDRGDLVGKCVYQVNLSKTCCIIFIKTGQGNNWLQLYLGF